MFKRATPSLVEVRTQLIKLIADAQEEARKQVRASAEQSETKSTFTFARTYPQQLVPRAKQILTSEMAKQMNKAQSNAQIGILVDLKALKSMPAVDVDLYLSVLLATVEDLLGPTFLKYSIVFAGGDYHNDRAVDLLRGKKWAEAEGELQSALRFVNLWQYPHPNKVLNLYYLAVSYQNQGKKDPAIKSYKQTLDEYEKLTLDQKSWEDMKKIYTDAKETLASLSK